jgi:hypothetical protein
MRRRTFIKAAGVTSAAITSGVLVPRLPGTTIPVPDVKGLPVGNSPAPLSAPHFPSRLHAFIWRNWPLVPAERLAAVVGATRKQIQDIADAMALGEQPPINRAQQQRSYITVIKRNWHLLPYEQLLALLGWSAEKLAYTLREDDFLFIKLGSHKPKCEPLRWSPPTDATSKREKEIARIVHDSFGTNVHSHEALFGFVEKLSAPLWFPKVPPATGTLRLCYSYFALYGDPLLEPDLDPYPDGYLARLSECGVNAVWLQAVLFKLAPFPWQPELSTRSDERLANLRRLVARAKRRGISVYLYFNEPRSLPNKFFDAHPQLKGAREGDHSALCTSVPEVQRWIRDAVAQICAAVPDLGGFFTITASENLTNCWSHGGGAKCPRCAKESPAAIIANVNRLVQEGIERARARSKQPNQKGPQVIAWDWGWNDAWAADIIKQLPNDCALMSVSEWSLPIERGGIKTSVGEYSISSIGPGPRAARHWDLARKRGLKVVAKVQAGTSWELSAVPYIPALENVAQHAANLRAAGVQNVMLGWTLGGYPSPNLEAVPTLLQGGATASVSDALHAIASRRFGKYAREVLRAWRELSAAFREFPYHIGVVYSGPQQAGPANLLFAKPTGYRATMVGFPYDDLNGWRSVYPPEIFAAQFEKVADGFAAGAARLAGTLPKRISSNTDKALLSELRVTQAAGIHFRSVANQTRFVMARSALAKVTKTDDANPHLASLERTLRDEIELAKKLHSLQRMDSRIGFEATNHYYYVPADLAEKVLNCHDLLERWLPAERQKWKA